MVAARDRVLGFMTTLTWQYPLDTPESGVSPDLRSSGSCPTRSLADAACNSLHLVWWVKLWNFVITLSNYLTHGLSVSLEFIFCFAGQLLLILVAVETVACCTRLICTANTLTHLLPWKIFLSFFPPSLNNFHLGACNSGSDFPSTGPCCPCTSPRGNVVRWFRRELMIRPELCSSLHASQAVSTELGAEFPLGCSGTRILPLLPCHLVQLAVC